MARADSDGVAGRYRELLAVHRLITATHERSAVMATVTTQAVRLLDAEAAALLMYERGALRVASSCNLGDPSDELRISDPDRMFEPIRELGRAAGFADTVCVPMVSRGELRGALAVFRRAPSGDSEDPVLLAALADVTVMALDIADRECGDDRLRQIQERYELALRGANLATWDWNIVTGEVAYNRRWAEVRGYRPEEVRSHVDSWLTGIHPDDVPTVQRVMTDYLEGRIPEYEVEHRVRTKAGDYLWILDRGKVFARDQRGRPLRMVGIEVDISAYKALEQRLHDTNAALDRAQAVAKTGSWRLDVARNMVEWSPEMYRIFGVSEDYPLSYEAFLALVHPDDRDYVDRVWLTATAGAPAYDIEHRILVGGKVRWVSEKANLEYDEHGRFVHGIGIAQDITERKHAEDALRLAEARSSGILSVSPDAIISMDDSFHITQINDAAVKIFGYTKDEASGAALDLLFPERLREEYRRHVQAFAEGLETSGRMGDRDGMMIARRKNGSEFPADVAISKLDVAGTRILTVALRDVTEQTRVAKKQRFLAEAGSVLAASLDYETTLTRVAELVVRQIADLCIVDIVDELGEIRRLKVVSGEQRQRDIAERLEHLELDTSRPFLLRTTLATKRTMLIRRVTESSLPVFAQSDEHLAILRGLAPTSIITVPMLVHDRLVGGLGLVSTTPSHLYGSADVRFAEELARRAALSIDNAQLYRTAQRAIQARDDLMGIVAHDLRSPLNAVRMQAQMFELSGPESAEQMHEAAKMIDRATARMSRLIDDLLDLTRVDAGQLAMEQTRVAPAELLGDSVAIQKPVAAAASLELRTELEPELPEIWADRNRLLQVLENLVGNAIKFSRAGGHVTVGARARDADVLFWVRDTGIGIAADALPHVFDRFWQAQRTDRRGAGLGLPITRGIVEAHGGSIWVESTLGVGSTFYFSIPLATPHYAAPGAHAPTSMH